MAYRNATNNLHLGGDPATQLGREFDALRAELDDIRSKYAAVLTDLVAVRAQYTAARADILAIITASGTLATKLNADAGVTDVNYVGAPAATAAALAANTAAALAAASFTA